MKVSNLRDYFSAATIADKNDLLNNSGLNDMWVFQIICSSFCSFDASDEKKISLYSSLCTRGGEKQG
jgi:hypothetical protein